MLHLLLLLPLIVKYMLFKAVDLNLFTPSTTSKWPNTNSHYLRKSFIVFFFLMCAFICSRARNVVAAAPPPLRFFSPESPVVDLYLGQLDQVRSQVDSLVP